MANEFIARKGIISLDDAQITGSLSVTNNISASIISGSFRGDGSQLTGISAGFPYTGSAEITGSLEVTGSISTDTDANINSLTVGKGGGNVETNTVLGYEALISNVEGEGSVAIGYKALSSSLAGMGPNTAVGNQALVNNVYGFRNTAVGNASLFSNTGGGFNTAVGNTALVSNTDGNENIAVGDGALNDNTEGDYNTGTGTFSLYSNIDGNNNTGIGHSSLYYNTSGSQNVGLGNDSLLNNETGSNNIAIGSRAGRYAGSSTTPLTSINNSILVGYQARALNATGDTNEIVIGYNVVGSGSNTTVIGNNSTVSTTLKGAVSASLFSGSFVGDGSQLTGIGSPIPLTATVNTGSSPFTLTSQSIVVADSTDGNLTINLPDLNAIVGTPNQKPIVVYKNDYSQNVIYVQPSGSQLVNGASQDIIVSIQLAVIYNPTSAGWVTEGTSAQSLAELELFFLPLTETGSLATTGSNVFIGNQIVTGSLTVTGGINATITGSATSASYVEYVNVANKPALVSSSAQIVGYNIFATTGSNQFNGSQAITGSLTVTGQVVAQTLNVQQVTSSIVFSSGSNIFGNSLSNTQQFTGSVSVTGSLAVAGVGANSGIRVGSTDGGRAFIRQSVGGDAEIGAITNGGLFLYANNTLGLSFTGAAATFASTVTALGGYLYGQTVNSFVRLDNSIGSQIGYLNYADVTFDSDGLRFFTGTGTSGSRTQKLLLAASGAATFASSVTTGADITLNPASDDGRISFKLGGFDVHARIIGDVTNASPVAGNLQFLTANAGTLSEKMRITEGGNVGIGTTSPSQKLEVVGGEIKAGRVDSSNEGGQVSFGRASDNATGWYIDVYGNTSTPDLRFVDVSNSAVRMTINSSGNTTFSGNVTVDKGITVSSNAFGNYFGKFGAASTSLLELREFTGDQTATTLILRSSRSDTFYHMQAFNNSSTECFRIESNGNVKNTNSSYGSLSDIKIKENIVDATPKLDDLLKVRIRNYNIIGQEVKQIGVIAQELEEIFPSMVDENQDRDNDGNLLETTTKGVKYSVFVPMLIKAIQEQQTQIESLKAEIQTLKQ